MSHKVLLADDSLTIQKVIKITLANQPYDLIEAPSEVELFKQLSLVKPKLVLLDFNLSDSLTGYELSAKIKAESPSTKILLLLGTFDTVEDSLMAKCGASDKIVKPFDSTKFIAICKQLIDTFSEEDISYPQQKVTESAIAQDTDDQWTIGHTTEQKIVQPETKPELLSSAPENLLIKEVSDWGMSVPAIIGDNKVEALMADLPPVIGEVKSMDNFRAKAVEATNPNHSFDVKFPDNSDLDYPGDTEDFGQPISKLISIESFNDQVEEIEIERNYVPDESNVKNIEAQIRDEVESNLWQADEFEDLKNEVAAKIEEVKSNFQPTRNDFDESLFKPLDDSDSIRWHDADEKSVDNKVEFLAHTISSSAINSEAMKTEIEGMVKKYVKEYMDEMFKQKTEKIAWEVIPDLAENLIRQELSKISNKIIDGQN